ncbi:MAG: PqqD family protein [Acidobacteriaceae bacterium]|nr:PqqD family protein [Acidobacteriaceae bacterium]
MSNRYTHIRSVINSDGAALFDLKRGTLTTLNPTGALLWQGLERGDDEDKLVALLAQDTQLSTEDIRTDVRAFVRQLREQSLIPG